MSVSAVWNKNLRIA